MPPRSHRHHRAAVLAAAAVGVTLGACGGGSSGGPVQGRVAIEAFEMAFDPDEIFVPAGRVEFTLTNAGIEAHTFVIDQRGFKLRAFDTGDTATAVVDLPEGAYFFYCDIKGHRDAGMEGALFVGDVAPPPTTDGGEG